MFGIWFKFHVSIIFDSRLFKVLSLTLCSANQWTGFYMITASVLKGLTHFRLIFSFSTSWNHRKTRWKGFICLILCFQQNLPITALIRCYRLFSSHIPVYSELRPIHPFLAINRLNYVFRGYKMETSARNGFINTLVYKFIKAEVYTESYCISVMEHFCDNYFPNYFRKKAPPYMFNRDLYRPNQMLDESNGIQKLNVIKTIHHLFLVNISLKL